MGMMYPYSRDKPAPTRPVASLPLPPPTFDQQKAKLWQLKSSL